MKPSRPVSLQPDPAMTAIRDELLRGEYLGLTGPFSFDHNGDVRKPVLIKIKQFTGGEFRVVVPLLDYTAQIAALP